VVNNHYNVFSVIYGSKIAAMLNSYLLTSEE